MGRSCHESEVEVNRTAEKPQYSRVEERLEGAMENTGLWTDDNGNELG